MGEAGSPKGPSFRPQLKLTHYRLDSRERIGNNVLQMFWETAMFRALVQEAAALTSLVLFVGMIAIWAQVLGTL